MDGRQPPGTVRVIATNTEHSQLHPRFFCDLPWDAWQPKDPMTTWFRMDWRMRNWYATVPFEKDQHLYVSHFIFANHTGGGWIINVHRYCLNQCIAGLDKWISDLARNQRELERLPK